MKKIAILLALVAAVSCAFAGCGYENNNRPNGNTGWDGTTLGGNNMTTQRPATTSVSTISTEPTLRTETTTGLMSDVTSLMDEAKEKMGEMTSKMTSNKD